MSRKNKFSELALQRLLDSNLSVKYSLTGRLFPTDITIDGFYDPGEVNKESTRFNESSLSNQVRYLQ